MNVLERFKDRLRARLDEIEQSDQQTLDAYRDAVRQAAEDKGDEKTLQALTEGMALLDTDRQGVEADIGAARAIVDFEQRITEATKCETTQLDRLRQIPKVIEALQQQINEVEHEQTQLGYTLRLPQGWGQEIHKLRAGHPRLYAADVLDRVGEQARAKNRAKNRAALTGEHVAAA